MFDGYSRRGRDVETSAVYSEQQVREVLNSIGVRIGAETNDDFLVMCPYHNNFRTAAAEVHKEKGLFVCFSCGVSGNFVDLVSFVNEINVFEAMRLIDSFASSPTEFDLDSILAEEAHEFDQELIKRLNSELYESQEAISYIEGRGIEYKSIADFSIGYSKNKRMITIPLKAPDGRYAGFVGRSIEGKRFENSKDLPRKNCLFNLDNNLNTREVFLVEASIDAIRIHQAGYPVVAALGKISKTQIALLNRYFSVVRIIADNDVSTGRPDETSLGAFKKLKKEFSGFVEMVTLPGEFKDAGDMTDYQIKSVLSKCYT